MLNEVYDVDLASRQRSILAKMAKETPCLATLELFRNVLVLLTGFLGRALKWYQETLLLAYGYDPTKLGML